MEVLHFISLCYIGLSMHVDVKKLNETINKVLNDYSIKGKVMTAVSDNCNLIKNSLTYSLILRHPCACHLISLFLKEFLLPSKDIILEKS